MNSEADTGVSLDYAQWNGAPKLPSKSQSVPISSPTPPSRSTATTEASPCYRDTLDSSLYTPYGVSDRHTRPLYAGTTVRDVYDETQGLYRVASPAIPRSARPLSATRPHMTRLTTGLREAKPASMRVVVKDPEEILRTRRKLLAQNKTKPSLNVKTVKSGKGGQPIVDKVEELCTDVHESKVPDTTKKVSKDKKKPPTESVSKGDVVLSNIDSDDDLIECLDELKVKSPRKVPKPKHFDDDDLFGEDDDGRRSTMEVLTSSDDDELAPVYRLEDLIPKKDVAKESPKDVIDTASISEDTEKPKKLKSKLNIGKKLIKRFYKPEAAKVAPLEAPSTKQAPRTAEELANIASMFCVETEAQASLRRYMTGQFIEEDYEGHFKPGVWDCELAEQGTNGGTSTVVSSSDSEDEAMVTPLPGAVCSRPRRPVRTRRKSYR